MKNKVKRLSLLVLVSIIEVVFLFALVILAPEIEVSNGAKLSSSAFVVLAYIVLRFNVATFLMMNKKEEKKD